MRAHTQQVLPEMQLWAVAGIGSLVMLMWPGDQFSLDELCSCAAGQYVYST